MTALSAIRPDMVGLSVMSGNWLSGRMILRWVKENLGCWIVVGGPHATALPESVLQAGADFVVRGEGEETVLELVRALEEGGNGLERIAGLSFRRGEQIVHNPPRLPQADLDSLPLPGFHLWDLGPYSEGGSGWGVMLPLLVGRGGEGTYRQRSPEGVAEEMALLARNHGRYVAHLIGDVLFDGGRWLEGLAHQMAARLLRVEWRCQAPLEHLTPRLLARMREAGCRWVDWHWEGNGEALFANWETVQRNVLWMTSMDVFSIGHFRLGGVGERPDHILRMVERISELELDAAEFSWFIPHPATPAWELVKDGGGGMLWEDYYESVGNPRGCATSLNVSRASSAEVRHLLRRARYLFIEARRRRKYQLYFGKQIGEALWWVSRQPWIQSLGWELAHRRMARGNGGGEEAERPTGPLKAASGESPTAEG